MLNFDVQVTMIKEGHWNIAFLTAVLLFSDVYSENQQFGKFRACVNIDQSLTLTCFYPHCDNSPPFNCHIFEVDNGMKTQIGSSDKTMVNSSVLFLNASAECQLNIKDHSVIYKNKSRIYTCSLSRIATTEEKNITVRYSGKENPKICRADGLFPRGLSGILLWSISIVFFQKSYL